MSLASASSAASELGAAPASMAASSFSHQEATRMQLHNEAFSLPEALLDHLMEAKLVTKEGEALPPQLSASQFKQLVPKLDKEKLTFWMVLHQEAYESFKSQALISFHSKDAQTPRMRIWATGKLLQALPSKQLSLGGLSIDTQSLQIRKASCAASQWSRKASLTQPAS